MERLPDELWLLIFRHLHKVDLLYSFSDLNAHFQQIIAPYADDIDLSDVPFTMYQRFCEQLLPTRASQLKSLTLKGVHQLRLFEGKVMQLVATLQRLKLDASDREFRTVDLQSYLKNLKSFQQLTDLHLVCNYCPSSLVESIVANAPSTLTNLILVVPPLYFRRLDEPLQMSHIKSLTLLPASMGSIAYLLPMMTHLEELTLFVSILDSSLIEKKMAFQTEPRSLKKLHLQIEQVTGQGHESNFGTLERFLHFFHRNQLQTLILIMKSDDSKLIDSIRSPTAFRDIFPCLTAFQYRIHTSQCPLPSLYSQDRFQKVEKLPPDDLYTVSNIDQHRYGALISLDDSLSNDFGYLSSDQPLKALYNARTVRMENRTDFSSGELDFSFQLPNLNKIWYRSPLPTASTSDEIKFFSKLLNQAKKLEELDLSTVTSLQMLELLNQLTALSLKNITRLICRVATDYHPAFLLELAQILPQLKYLYLYDLLHMMEEAINDGNEFLTAAIAMAQIKIHFRNLIHFEILHSNAAYEHRAQEHEALKQRLNSSGAENVYYSSDANPRIGSPYFGVWT